MYRPRVIPVLLLRNSGLVKSVAFKDYRYIGDPINAVKIFNDKRADELVFLDITASKENRLISLEFVHKVGDEANMPFAVGGGIRNVKDIRSILENGAEKVVLNSVAYEKTDFIKAAADSFGSSTIVVCIDVKKNLFGNYKLVYKNASRKIEDNPIEFAQKMEEYGAGEIIIQSVDKDGTYQGYDLELIRKVAESVTLPVIGLGGAGDYKDFTKCIKSGLASAVAAGSLFVYHGPRRAVLISFPTKSELKNMFE
ncbi:MAG TPA: AglZ/HisF2 family acetamidino modification protein [Ignavibacteriaceae bacterium]|nr:AglZ/HisF2 family acetamidino modification protein [Ignavibacteriaceae bacterium]